MAIVERRVLQVHKGEVDQNLGNALAQNAPELEERDDVPPGTFRLKVEKIDQVPPINWRARWAAAITPIDKLDVLADLLQLK